MRAPFKTKTIIASLTIFAVYASTSHAHISFELPPQRPTPSVYLAKPANPTFVLSKDGDHVLKVMLVKGQRPVRHRDSFFETQVSGDYLESERLIAHQLKEGDLATFQWVLPEHPMVTDDMELLSALIASTPEAIQIELGSQGLEDLLAESLGPSGPRAKKHERAYSALIQSVLKRKYISKGLAAFVANQMSSESNSDRTEQVSTVLKDPRYAPVIQRYIELKLENPVAWWRNCPDLLVDSLISTEVGAP